MNAPYILAIILVTTQVTYLHAQAEKNCPPGQIFVALACKPCPAGTYRVANTTNTCIKCPKGTFSRIRGVGSRRLCRFCDSNKFTNKAGSTQCKRCPEGTVANRGASRCRACGPGFRLFSNRCEICPESTYNEKNASLECKQCPFWLASPRQSTSRSACKTCPPGQVGNYGIGCAPCSEGLFKPRREGICKDCPPGSVAKPGSAACKQCPPGTFSRKQFEQKCKLCPEGTSSNGPSATRCRAIGSIRCPSDTFENANGDCDHCRFGFRYNKEKKLCERCPSGSVSKGGLQTRCIKCPPGQIAENDLEVGCKCPQGMFRKKRTCKPCPRGTGGNFINVAGRSGCITCDPGFFSDKPGSKHCKPCPFGTFSAEGGAKRCSRCPRGAVANPISLSALGGSTRCISITTGCPLGFQSMRDVFGTIRCRRVDCPVGTPEKDIGIECLPCRPGSRLVGDKCKKCPIDSVSDGGVITVCTKCKNGLFRSFFDDSKCSCDGDPGTGKGLQDGVCKDCPPGSFGNPNLPECIKCSRGWFASGFGNEYCTRCPKGTFSDVKGSASCKTCPSGQIPEKPIGSKECVPTT